MIFVIPPIVIFCIAMFILNQSTTLKERQAAGGMVGQAALIFVIILIAWVVIVTPIMFVGGAVYYMFFSGALEIVKEPPAVVYYEEGEEVVLQLRVEGGEWLEHQWQVITTEEMKDLKEEYGEKWRTIRHSAWSQGSFKDPINYLSDDEADRLGLSGSGKKAWQQGSAYYYGPWENGKYNYQKEKVEFGSVIELYPEDYPDLLFRGVVDDLGWNRTCTRVIRFKAKERKE